MENFEIRLLLCHYWKQEVKASEAVKKICKAEGEDVLSICTAQNGLKSSMKDTDLRDEPRSICCITVNIEAICDAIEANSSTLGHYWKGQQAL